MNVMIGKHIRICVMLLSIILFVGCEQVPITENSSASSESVQNSSAEENIANATSENVVDKKSKYSIIEDHHACISIDDNPDIKFHYKDNPEEGVMINSGDITVIWRRYDFDSPLIQIVSDNEEKEFHLKELVEADYGHFVMELYNRYIFFDNNAVYFFFTANDVSAYTKSYCYKLDIEKFEFTEHIELDSSELSCVTVIDGIFCVFTHGFHVPQQYLSFIDVETLTQKDYKENQIGSYKVDENQNIVIYSMDGEEIYLTEIVEKIR